MITRVIIKNYRLFQELTFLPEAGLNVIVGDNESGKSTLLEGISMTLNGRINGRWIGDDLNPYWFNKDVVEEFFNAYAEGSSIPTPPHILIEVYFSKEDPPQKQRGKENTLREDCPGISLSIDLDKDYKEQFLEYLKSEHPPILPVEYYSITWKGFDGTILQKRPAELQISYIDSRTIRSSSGIDHHTRQMLSDNVEKKEGATISLALRKAKHELTKTVLDNVNKKLQDQSQAYEVDRIGLEMDQSSSASWDASVVPQIDSIPFAMAGQGQQVIIKMALALHASIDKTNFVFVEEPENHLSFTNLTRIISMIEKLSHGRQSFVSTHSAYVLNRLGLDKLHLINKGHIARFDELSEDTVNYFKKLSGYDTLRLVLANKIVIVEGPSDEMVFNRAYLDVTGKNPRDEGVDVFVQGIQNRRGLELCKALNKSAAVIRDVDKQTPEYWKKKADGLLMTGIREMFIGSKENGTTLEKQIINANSEKIPELKMIVGCPTEEDLEDYMIENKTEVAWRITSSSEKINYPDFIQNAIDFVRK